ncbi:MAG: CDP-alcohol phosphatidyltransferase family protein [Candidatus Aenigmatarchaeota archaeon]|nr:MAG: CDP-alcohol phosphatidyltransferase family protein [Candidatus Aenigmarchaeota archaeon]
MTFYAKRQRFEGVSAKIGKALAGLGLSPNQWTILSIIAALGSFYLLLQQSYIFAAVFFIIAAFFDMADGAVARETGKSSKFGAYLDTMADRLVEFIIVLGMVFLAGAGFLPPFILPAVIWVFIFYFGSIMTTYAKSAAKEKGLVKDELRGGLLERSERLIILFIGIVLAAISPMYLTYTLVLLAILTNITALQRFWLAKNASG